MATLLSERIKTLREQRGWPQEHLAAASGVSARTIRRIERGQSQPTLETSQAIAAAFNIEVSELHVGFTAETLEALQDDYLCPYCGSLLAMRTFVPNEYGDTELEAFECGYTRGADSRPCPTDPRFPKFEDYELLFQEERNGVWYCHAIGQTEMARRVSLQTGSGRSKEHAEMWMRRSYVSARDGYEAAEAYTRERWKELSAEVE